MQGFGKHQNFIVRHSEPSKGGRSLGLLHERSVTLHEEGFLRRHGDVPVIDRRTYRLVVRGLVKRPVVISLSTIRHLFSKVAVTATLSCAGNRRDDLSRVNWVGGETLREAVGAAEWGGVPLGEVLEYAGLKFGARHVAFTGLDDVKANSQATPFGSLPVEKAMSSKVLLAYEVNGAPLTPEHGAPLRLVVPGDIAAHSVKWLGEIRVLASPSKSYFRRFADRFLNQAGRLDRLGQIELWQANL